MTPPVNRRTFLQATAASGLAVAATARGATQAPSENLHFALIGAGGQGTRIATEMLKNPGAKLTALCEIQDRRRDPWLEKAPGARAYTDWNEMLAKETDLQAVLVALPEHTHEAATVAALNAGKHVFCEKPMAYSLEHGRAMIEAWKASGKVLQIGQQRRSNPIYYLALELIQKKGLLGEILRVDAFWDRAADWKRPLPEDTRDYSPWGFPTLNHLVNWRLYRQYSHGLMTENGTHQLDATRWLLGDKKPVRVCGMGTIRYPDGRETHDIASAEYLYEGDVIVRFTQDFHQGLNYGWEYGELFLGSEGALRVTEEREVVHYPKGSKQGTKISAAELGSIEFPGVSYSKDELAAVADYRGFSYENELKIFANCLRGGLQPTCTPTIGYNSIVPTVLGTVAQFERKYIEFEPSIWA